MSTTTVVYTPAAVLDDLDDAEIVHLPPPDLVPLPSGLIKRLYGPAILQHTLEGKDQSQKKTPSDVDDSTSWSDEKVVFHQFVNRLAYVCDSKPKGKTVTAVAVLDSGIIQYRLTSNERSEPDFKKVKQYLTDEILGLLSKVSDDALKTRTYATELSSRILLNVLRFTRRRVKCYVNLLVQNIVFCIQRCESDQDTEVQGASEALRSIQRIAQESMDSWSDPETFSSSCRNLLYTIKTHKRIVGALLRSKTSNSDLSASSSTSWTQIQHAIGRLDAYYIAVKGIVDARRRWPMLFSLLEVTHVSSRPRFSNPITMKETACNARNILKISQVDQKVIDAYEDSFLQTLSLDEQIKEEIKNPKFNTQVHAEANLLDSIYRSSVSPQATDTIDHTRPRFFDERRFGRYIGTSKSACVLCDLFFKAHPMGVKTRETHGTLYAKWRAPDVYGHDTREMVETRRKVVEKMAAEMNKIVSQGILDRTGGGRRWDSRHETSDALRTLDSWSVRGSVQMDDASSTVGMPGGRSRLEDVREDTETLRSQMGERESVNELSAQMGSLTVLDSNRGSKYSWKRPGRGYLIVEEDDE